MFKKLGVLILLACLPACMLADFSYDQSTKVTGGMMAGVVKFAGAFSKQAREPVQSTVAVKGNRLFHGSKDRASVIDLDNETITEINYQKKTYSVMTFAEMKQAMEQAMQRMKDAPKQPQPQESQQQKPDVKTEFNLDLKETGQTKEIAGLQAKEVILTMKMEGADQQSGNKGAMIVTSDMWLVPKIRGYGEIGAFYKRMGEKLAWTPDAGANPMMGRPDMARAMANMRKEGAKMDGIPVLTVMKMTGSAEGQTSDTQTQTTSGQAQPQPQPKPDLGSMLGGKFGGFGRKKKQDDSQASSTPPPSDSASASGSLMETTTKMSSFSAAPLDPSRFSPPAGFKKVESEMMKRQH